MKKNKIVPVMLILVFLLMIFTACTGSDITQEEIGQYTDETLGVTYIIYKTSDKQSNTEKFFASVASVNPSNSDLWASSITIPSQITYMDIVYDITTIGNLAFYKSGYDFINISEGITRIESFAFDRSKATDVNLPSTIISIGEYAFLDCMSLKNINLKAEEPPVLGKYAFMVYSMEKEKYINSEILQINVPVNSKSEYNNINKYPEWESYQGNIR